MANFCGNCGVRLDAAMRVCPNCGRMVSMTATPPRRAVPASAPAPARTAKRRSTAPRPQPKRRAPVYEEEEEEAPSRGRAAFVLIRRFLVIAVVIGAVYFAAFALQVVRVKHSTYEFEVSADWLTAKNYGQAFENSTEDGKWHYNIVTQRVRYTATHNGQPIEVIFSALGTVKVVEVDYDGKERTDDEEISHALMGLYI